MRCRERVTPSDSGILPVASRYFYTAKNKTFSLYVLSTRGAEARGREPTHRFWAHFHQSLAEGRAGSRRNRQRGVQERDERECARSENMI